MTVSPTVVGPGDRFAVKYTERRPRTDTLFLTGAGAGDCSLLYMLYQGRYWKELGTDDTLDNLARVDLLRTVHGTVPTSADPGVYTVCDAEGTACARLTVRR